MIMAQFFTKCLNYLEYVLHACQLMSLYLSSFLSKIVNAFTPDYTPLNGVEYHNK
jgi:hypothetical protein